MSWTCAICERSWDDPGARCRLCGGENPAVTKAPALVRSGSVSRKEETVQKHYRLPASLAAEIERRAGKRGETENTVVAVALAAYFNGLTAFQDELRAVLEGADLLRDDD